MVGLVVVRKQDLEVFSCRWEKWVEIDGVAARGVELRCVAKYSARLYGSRQSRVWGGGDGLHAVWRWSELSSLTVAARSVVSQHRWC